MEISIIGSGPAGMAAALLLAGRGHRVTLVDRDPGPPPNDAWKRVGVMQFHLPHGFRSQSRSLLIERLPGVHDAVIEAGACLPPTAPGLPAPLQVRRSVFERSFWETVDRDPRVRRVAGHVDAIEVDGHRVQGIVVDSQLIPADLVVDASGRCGRLSGAYRPIGQRVDCGMAYAARQFRLLRREDQPPGLGVTVFEQRAFNVMVFSHDAGTFTVLFVRPSDDRVLAELRHPAVFEAACDVVPGLAAWTDPERSEPIDVVRAGAGLVNEYRRQPVRVAGLVAIGDAWCTTNPQGGRGITLGLRSAAALADAIEEVPLDELGGALDAWGEVHLKPWFHDHVEWDASLLRSWAGEPVDPDGPIGIQVIMAATQAGHQEWMPTLGAYFDMQVPPTALEQIRAQVRDLVRGGWQPPTPAGMTRVQLAELIDAQLKAATPVSA